MTETSGVPQLKAEVGEAFEKQFGGEPAIWVRSPGRVNLIGEHTDYNDGFVLPIAIERQIILAARPAEDDTARLFSTTLGGGDSFSIGDISHTKGWAEYPRGVAWSLTEAGFPVRAADIVLASDLPTGAGLSSSAAIEVGVGWTLAAIGGFEIDRARLAVLSRRAENAWVGVASGIMDQFIVALGRADHALLVDTRDLSYRLVPLPSGVSIVIADTNVKRGLVDSEYNARRAETAEAARLMGAPSLRDVSWDEFDTRSADLPELLKKRARHIVSENTRVLEAVDALEKGDVETVGRLMDASHVSLRDDYAVSHPRLDLLVEIARSVPGVYGARMTGAGFGGATVSLVADDAVPEFQRVVAQKYAAETGQAPPIYVTRATDGVKVIE
ncbi:MAG: galactokinase [Anaerolineae bacterium]